MKKISIMLNKDCQNSFVSHEMLKFNMANIFGGVTIYECSGVWYDNKGIEYSDDNIEYVSYCIDYNDDLKDFYQGRIEYILERLLKNSKELCIMYIIDNTPHFYTAQNNIVRLD